VASDQLQPVHVWDNINPLSVLNHYSRTDLGPPLTVSLVELSVLRSVISIVTLCSIWRWI